MNSRRLLHLDWLFAALLKVGKSVVVPRKIEALKRCTKANKLQNLKAKS